MRSKKNRMAGLSAIALLLAVSGTVYGGEWSVLSQTDMKAGNISFTNAFVSPKLEVWCFNHPNFRIWEVGRLGVVDAGKSRLTLLGGYLSYQEVTEDLFAEGFAIHKKDFGNSWNLHSAGGFYAPLTGGSWSLFSPETRLVKPVQKGTEVGLAGDLWWFEGARADFRVGPIVRFSGDAGTLSLRYFPEDKFARFEVAAPIKF